MPDTNAYRIDTLEKLREIIGAPSPAVDLKVSTEIDQFGRAFIGRAPFIVLSTSDANGAQDVSPKGDGPGFVAVEDDRTILIPDRKGNRLIFGLQNILINPHVGVLFIIPGISETYRINGHAELTSDPAVLERLSARGQPALLAIRVTVEECFFHCAKAFIRSALWKHEAWPKMDKISFGKMFAAKMGGDEEMAKVVDQMIEEDYKVNL
jgi:PPOX class probable FMN-dependent enzyme